MRLPATRPLLPSLPCPRRSLLSRLNALRAADVATTLYALAMFNVAPGQAVLDSLCGRLVACMQGGGGDPQQQGGAALPGANAVELATSYWALGLLGETQRPLFAQLEAALAERLEAKGLNESLQRMVFAVGGWERPTGYSATRTGGFSMHASMACVC